MTAIPITDGRITPTPENMNMAMNMFMFGKPEVVADAR
jgi:hypothetical protein